MSCVLSVTKRQHEQRAVKEIKQERPSFAKESQRVPITNDASLFAL